MNDMSQHYDLDAPTWESCHAEGLTKTKAARKMRSSHLMADRWALASGNAWPVSKHAYVNPDAPSPLPPVQLIEDEAPACRALWATVLTDQWRLVFDPTLEELRLRQHINANCWFGGEDFHMVCALAGLDGAAVLDRYRARRAKLRTREVQDAV